MCVRWSWAPVLPNWPPRAPKWPKSTFHESLVVLVACRRRRQATVAMAATTGHGPPDPGPRVRSRPPTVLLVCVDKSSFSHLDFQLLLPEYNLFLTGYLFFLNIRLVHLTVRRGKNKKRMRVSSQNQFPENLEGNLNDFCFKVLVRSESRRFRSCVL